MNKNSLKILIVDDDKSFRKLVELKLKSWNSSAVFEIAGTLREASDLLNREDSSFALIVLDQHLPDGLGPSLLSHPKTKTSAILATSSDRSPELMGNAVKAGAGHFLDKTQIKEALFLPLVEALLESKRLETELLDSKLKESRLQTVKTLISTLRHEINNPLGGVMGATYLLKIESSLLSVDQLQALKLIESSGQRIKHVLDQLCQAAEIEEVKKGQENLFQVPGDKKWE